MAETRERMRCPECGHEMNHHADKVVFAADGDTDPIFGGQIHETHTCPACGNIEMRPAERAG